MRASFATLDKRWRLLSLALVLAASLGMSVCGNAPGPQGVAGPQRATSPQKVIGPAAAVQTTTYDGVGVVKGIDVKRPSIEIDHQEIKGLMPAMTMEFYVKDKSLLEGLRPGDHIEFIIENGVGGVKITVIRRL